MDNTVSAYLADGAKVTSGGSAAVMASDGSTIKSLAGAVSGAGKATVGASFALNEIGDSITAYVNNSTHVLRVRIDDHQQCLRHRLVGGR
jgi:hypothetical protein